MNYQRRRIAINSILLDLRNARHGVLNSQKQILEWMVTEPTKEKVLNLAKEIAAHGLSPNELPILIPDTSTDKNKYIVVEGNRRLAALKMLRKPASCPIKKVKSQFEKIAGSSEVDLPKSLWCIIYPTLEEAEYWIKLRHGGQNNGAGTVDWGPKEFDSFEKRMGRRTPNSAAISLLSYALSEGIINQEQYSLVPVTNVTRLVGTKDARHVFGAYYAKGEVKRIADKEYFDRAIKDIFIALSGGYWTVTKLKSGSQRKDFVDQLKEENNWGKYEAVEPAALEPTVSEHDNVEEEDADEKSKDRTSSRGNKKSTSRSKLLPADLKLKIKNKRLNDIFVELKSMHASNTNSCAVLTRVFIEGCTDVFLKNSGVEVGYNDKLEKKAIDARKLILGNHNNAKHVKDDLKGYEHLSGPHNTIGSANFFNNIVHNMSFSVSSEELKTHWNNLANSLKWFEGYI
ncbi:ParB N-terminal domain-containing protein [Kushneria indalinina]|uniref:ParB-like nuclease family protein n=1 Tax=Kushneria indalinina DSM 14324 TaxID=1122140 RepID=A0A3D9DW39_9GAMM|nr:ParB N-terminal domain-containing protein [Kushneria indalinina]REC94865.1 ParB-like nuclease family protein [Kushneria indalinina DSM 14324]